MASGSALVLSVTLIALAAWTRAVTGSWLQPGAFFILLWCFAAIVPLLAAPKEPVGVNVIFWILAASVAVSAGTFVGNGGLKTRRLALASPPTSRECLTYGSILALSIVLGTVSNFAFMSTSGIGLADVLDIQKLVVTANQAYTARYVDPSLAPSHRLSQSLLPFVYLGPAVGGIFFEMTCRVRWKLFALTAFLPAVAVTMLQTTKAAVLFAITLWLSGYFATRLRFGKVAVFTRSHILVAAGVGSFLTAFLFAVSFARLASTDVSLMSLVILKLVSAAFGHMTVFSQWLGDYWHQPFDPSLGAVTFAGPLDMLGFGQRVPGLFENVIDLVVGESSNIYTAFRPLIQDFSMPGALAVLGLLGFVGGTGFRLVTSGRWSGAPLLILTYMTIFWTPITWFWVYNSLTGAVVAVGFIVLFIRLWRADKVASFQRERIASAN